MRLSCPRRLVSHISYLSGHSPVITAYGHARRPASSYEKSNPQHPPEYKATVSRGVEQGTMTIDLNTFEMTLEALSGTGPVDDSTYRSPEVQKFFQQYERETEHDLLLMHSFMYSVERGRV